MNEFKMLPGHIVILEFPKYFSFSYSKETGLSFTQGLFLKEYQMDVTLFLN